MQSRTDAAAQAVRQLGGYTNAAVYGTLVHTNLHQQITSLNNPDFRSEVSLVKSMTEAPYGRSGSIRIDVLENLRNGTVCVYDIKTGRSPLTAARSIEIATNARAFYPSVQRILVIETRPGAGP